MSTTEALLREIKDGAEAIGIAPTTLCQRAVKNGRLIRRLENGGRVTTETVDQIRAFIRENLPTVPAAASAPEKESEVAS